MGRPHGDSLFTIVCLCLAVWVLIYSLLTRFAYSSARFFYFNPADYYDDLMEKKARAASNPSLPERAFPRIPPSSKTVTFEPLMKQYFDLAKVLVTVAGASIVFGGVDPTNVEVYRAKLMLAGSIFFCLAFCLTCLKYYEDYTHDMESYTAKRISLVESLGLSGILFFFFGYVCWANYLHSPIQK
jgi:hypothetical protein